MFSVIRVSIILFIVMGSVSMCVWKFLFLMCSVLMICGILLLWVVCSLFLVI